MSSWQGSAKQCHQLPPPDLKCPHTVILKLQVQQQEQEQQERQHLQQQQQQQQHGPQQEAEAEQQQEQQEQRQQLHDVDQDALLLQLLHEPDFVAEQEVLLAAAREAVEGRMLQRQRSMGRQGAQDLGAQLDHVLEQVGLAPAPAPAPAPAQQGPAQGAELSSLAIMLLLRMMQLLLTLLLLYVCSMCASSIAQGVGSVAVALMRKADTLSPVPWLVSQCLGMAMSSAQWLLSGGCCLCMWVLSAVQAVVLGICGGVAQGTCRILVQAPSGKEDLHLALPGDQHQTYLAAAPCVQLLMLAPALGSFVTVVVPAVLVGLGGMRVSMWLAPGMTAKKTCAAALLLGILAAQVLLSY
jgi:hypothetical protein